MREDAMTSGLPREPKAKGPREILDVAKGNVLKRTMGQPGEKFPAIHSFLVRRICPVIFRQNACPAQRATSAE
jgi:hypothetical protein